MSAASMSTLSPPLALTSSTLSAEALTSTDRSFRLPLASEPLQKLWHDSDNFVFALDRLDSYGCSAQRIA
jgi:hypothetical protein